MTTEAHRYVMMGVAGSGKSTIAAGFADAMGLTFIDGDALHPDANIKKMSQGQPLTDEDRWPWLAAVGQNLRESGTVIACSALKRVYRDLICREAGAPVTFLYLRGQRDTLLARMSSRPGHFMPPSLLDSQLETLEEPAADEATIRADIEDTPDQIIATFVNAIKERNS